MSHGNHYAWNYQSNTDSTHSLSTSISQVE